MSSTYQAILQAAKQKVDAVTGMSAVTTVLRKEPTMVALQDKRRQVVVAGRGDLAELIGERQFSNSIFLGYEVYVLLVTERVWDLDTLWFRLEKREQVRLALSVSALLSASQPGQWDYDYDPSPGGVDASWLTDTLDMTAQKFTYWVSQPERNAP